MVGKWTWGCENRPSVLDYVLVSEWWVDRISRFSIDDEGFFYVGSDHNLLLLACHGWGKEGKCGRGKGETKVQEGVEVENKRESRLGKVSAEGGGEDGFVFGGHDV